MTQIFTAKTVEEAKELAAKTFGAAQSDISFEVIEEPKKGLFGFKKGEARIRATYMSVSVEDATEEPAKEVIEAVAEVQPAALAAPAEEPAEAVAITEESFQEEEAPAEVEITDFTENVSAAAPAEEASAPAEEEEKKPIDEDAALISGEPSEAALEKVEKAKTYLSAILEKMGIQAELEVTAGAESAMIDIVTPNSGTVIGKRGETLDALQYLTFMIANRGDKDYYRIILNSANYRERRRKTLEELAAKIAKNVLRSGRQTSLEPMNPYERRIIHSAISEIEGVSSKSVGEEPYRKVVISSLNSRPGRRRNNRSDKGERTERNNRGGRNNNRRNHSDAPPTRTSMDFMKTSFEMDYKRPKPEDDLNAGLYGKIEF